MEVLFRRWSKRKKAVQRSMDPVAARCSSGVGDGSRPWYWLWMVRHLVNGSTHDWHVVIFPFSGLSTGATWCMLVIWPKTFGGRMQPFPPMDGQYLQVLLHRRHSVSTTTTPSLPSAARHSYTHLSVPILYASSFSSRACSPYLHRIETWKSETG